MDKVKLAKQISHITIMIGTGRIVSGIIERNAQPKNVTEKVAIKATSFAIGGMASEALAKNVDEKIDEIVSWWKKDEDVPPAVYIA